METNFDKEELAKDLEKIKQTFKTENTLKYLNFNMIDCKGMADMCGHRMTLLYFVVGSYFLLDLLDDASLPSQKQEIKAWVYNQQIKTGGFRGGPFLFQNLDQQESSKTSSTDVPHIANTYAALCILHMCGDYQFEKVNRTKLLKSVIAGCYDKNEKKFRCTSFQSENDIRFTFCACAISKLLNDYSYLDKPNIVKSLVNLQNTNGGFTWNKYAESHAGITYCVVASLSILGALGQIFQFQKLVEFLVNRFVGGFNGRVNKPPDCCYSFWCLASLQILAQEINQKDPDQKSGIEMFDGNNLVRDLIKMFNLECMAKGGFCKFPTVFQQHPFPDVYHTFYGLASLSIVESTEESVQLVKNQIDCQLGLCMRKKKST